jgi:hypothetical protein
MATKTKIPDTTVIIETDNGWKIKIFLGLGGLACLVILGFLYRIEAGIIALLIGGAYAARIFLVGWHNHKLAGYEARRLEAETAKAEAEAVAAKAASYFVETNSGVFQLVGIAVERFYPAVSASKLLADMPPQLALPAPEPQHRRLLDVDFIHLLVVGPSGAGKTTVLCHLIDNAPGNTLIYALDPHNQFNEWPGRVSEIVGDGRDYPAIDAKLLNLIEVMNRRYNGAEGTTQKILIVADEWLSILDKCLNAKEFFNTIGSEARKVNMSLVISSISATVDDLNVSGAIRDNLAQLTLSRTLKAQNLAEMKWSRADKELVELPGRYIPRLALPPARPAQPINPPPVVEDDFDLIDFDSGPVAPSPDPVELRIFQLYQAGLSLNAIYKEVYPGRSYGGIQAAELKAVLAGFGVSL